MTTISGDSSSNTLSGTTKADTISAGGGNDTVYAGNGNDRISAGSGDDTVYGGAGNDRIDAGRGDDFVDGGAGNDRIDAGSGNDIVDGGTGNDVIDGGKGDDTIYGGAGKDTIDGGAGNDVFVYLTESDSTTGSWDRIIDFTHGFDQIDLSAFRGDLDLNWSGSTAGTEYGVWYDHSGASTFVYADTSGDGTADLKIELKNTGDLQLTSADFIGVSNAPVAVHDMATTNEDHGTVIDVLANDRGPGNDGQNDFHDHDHDDHDGHDDCDDDDDHDDEGHGDTIFLTSFDTSGTVGRVTKNNDGTLSYDPNGRFEYLAVGESATDTFRYTISDGHGGHDTAAVTVTVTGVNDGPVAVDVSTAATEDGAAVTAAFSADDVDSDDDPTSLTYTIVADLGAGEGSVVNNGDGSFTFDPGADFQSLAEAETTMVDFTYKATDSHGADSGTQTATITITGENDAPMITSIDSGVSANVPAAENSTAVTDVNADDVDNGHVLNFSILGGADAAKFSIDHDTGVLTFNEAPDFENPTDEGSNNTYDVIVQVSDEKGATDVQSIAVTVTDVNEQPAAGADLVVDAAENVADTVVLADVNASDPDFGGGNDDANDFEDLTYSIFAGNDAGLFEIDAATGGISLATGRSLNFETTTQHVLTVRATDGPGLYDETQVTINVTDVNEQPNAGADFAVSAAENVADTTVLADVNATDPDFGGGNDGANDFEDLTYSIFAGNDTGLFEIDAATGGISLATGRSLDFETAPQHVLTVQATDGPGLFDKTQVTINVTGNHPPVANDDSVFTNVSINELEGFNIPEWALLANDIDPDGNPIDIEFGSVGGETGGTATHTAGNGTDGFVRFTGSGPESGLFSYKATDGAPSIQTADVTVAVDFDMDGTPGDVDDILVGTDNDGSRIVGGGGNDILIGGNNQTLGDTLNGGDGDDTLSGGAGNDILNGGDGNDTAVYFDANPSGVTVNLGITTSQNVQGNLGHDTLSGIENLSGSKFDDTLTGDGVANVLQGLGGKDDLTGGAGNDVFDYNATSDSGTTPGTRDLIKDFEAGSDLIDLSGIDANTGTGGDDAFTFVDNESPFDDPGIQANSVTWYRSGGNTIIQGDVDGIAGADFQIELMGLQTLADTDFIL